MQNKTKKKKNVKRLNYLLIYKSDLSGVCGGCIIACAAGHRHYTTYKMYILACVLRIFASVTFDRQLRNDEQRNTTHYTHTNDVGSVTKRLVLHHCVRHTAAAAASAAANSQTLAHRLCV